jgi:hypothetical protein
MDTTLQHTEIRKMGFGTFCATLAPEISEGSSTSVHLRAIQETLGNGIF